MFKHIMWRLWYEMTTALRVSLNNLLISGVNIVGQNTGEYS